MTEAAAPIERCGRIRGRPKQLRAPAVATSGPFPFTLIGGRR